MRSAISSPGRGDPSTRWASMSLAASDRSMRRLPSLFESDVRTPAGTQVRGAGTEEPVIRVLLEQLGGPSRDPGHRNNGHIEFGGDAKRVEERGRVVIDIGVESLFAVDDLVQPFGDTK